MTTLAFTGSSRARVRACPASAALPHVGNLSSAADIGTALHEHIEQRIKHGVETAMAGLPSLASQHGLGEDDARIFEARARAFAWEPPAGARAEVALGLDTRGLRGHAIVGGRGQYNVPPGWAPYAATIDIVYADPYPLETGSDGCPIVPSGSTLYVVDLKTGQDVHVEAPDHNAQLRLGAVLAARWVAWEEPELVDRLVAPGLLWLRKGLAAVDVGPPLTGHDIDRELLALAREVGAVRRQQDLLAAGQPLTGLVEGPHCDYCPARASCPAKTAAVAALVGDAGLLAPTTMTPEKLRRALALLPRLTALAEQIKDLAKAEVERTGQPIPVADGKAWGPNPHTTKVLDVDGVMPILVDVMGPELAAKAVQRSVTGSSIGRALKGADLAPDVVAHHERVIWAKAAEAGVIGTTTETWWSNYKVPGLVVDPLPPSPPVVAGAAPTLPEPAARPRKARKGAKHAPAAAPPTVYACGGCGVVLPGALVACPSCGVADAKPDSTCAACSRWAAGIEPDPAVTHSCSRAPAVPADLVATANVEPMAANDADVARVTRNLDDAEAYRAAGCPPGVVGPEPTTSPMADSVPPPASCPAPLAGGPAPCVAFNPVPDLDPIEAERLARDAHHSASPAVVIPHGFDACSVCGRVVSVTSKARYRAHKRKGSFGACPGGGKEVT